MSHQQNSAAHRHAQDVKDMLEIFCGQAMPAWAIDLLAGYSEALHAATFPPAPRGPAKILPFTPRKKARKP